MNQVLASTHLGTVTKSLLECLQTTKRSELSRKRRALQEASMMLQYNRVKNDDSYISLYINL